MYTCKEIVSKNVLKSFIATQAMSPAVLIQKSDHAEDAALNSEDAENCKGFSASSRFCLCVLRVKLLFA